MELVLHANGRSVLDVGELKIGSGQLESSKVQIVATYEHLVKLGKIFPGKLFAVVVLYSHVLGADHEDGLQMVLQKVCHANGSWQVLKCLVVGLRLDTIVQDDAPLRHRRHFEGSFEHFSFCVLTTVLK